jgi:hypothetical protein
LGVCVSILFVMINTNNTQYYQTHGRSLQTTLASSCRLRGRYVRTLGICYAFHGRRRSPSSGDADGILVMCSQGRSLRTHFINKVPPELCQGCIALFFNDLRPSIPVSTSLDWLSSPVISSHGGACGVGDCFRLRCIWDVCGDFHIRIIFCHSRSG